MISNKEAIKRYTWTLEKGFGRRGKFLKVVCPKCNKIGTLYYNTRLGWYIKHGAKQTHSIPENTSLTIPLHRPRLIFFKYMGGDQYLIRYISNMIPPHKCYVEVFGGAAPLLLNKPPSKVEIYNDIDGNIINLFKVVKERYDDFMREIEWLVDARQTYYDFMQKIQTEKDPVKRAVMYFYIINRSINSSFGTAYAITATRNKARPFWNKVEMLRLVHKRLKNVVIESLDFREILKHYDSKLTFFYLDPPHLFYATEKGQDYYETAFTDKDYFDLLNMLLDLEGKWLLKQNYIPYIVQWANENELSMTTIEFAKHSSVGKNRPKRFMKVCFIANYPLKNRRGSQG